MSAIVAVVLSAVIIALIIWNLRRDFRAASRAARKMTREIQKDAENAGIARDKINNAESPGEVHEAVLGYLRSNEDDN